MLLRFQEPYENSPPGLDGLVYRFPFQLIKPGSGARKDSVSEYTAEVKISGTLLSMWGFQRWNEGSDEIAATLFEYAREAIIDRLAQNKSLENIVVNLRSNTAEHDYPFDKDCLAKPDGAEYEFDLEELSRQYRNQQDDDSTIGFQLPDPDDDA